MTFYRDRARELLIQREAIHTRNLLEMAFDASEDFRIQNNILWTEEGLGLMDSGWITRAMNKKTNAVHRTLLKLIGNVKPEESGYSMSGSAVYQ